MTTYRILRLKPDKNVLDFETFECSNDYSAIREAQRLASGEPVELWEDGRMVATVRKNDAPFKPLR